MINRFPRLEGESASRRPSFNWQAEYARSGRSKCRVCHELIPEGDLRIALMLQDLEGYKSANWTHFDCFWKHREARKLDKVDKIHGFERLEDEDQLKIRKALTRFINSLKKPPVTVGPFVGQNFVFTGVLKSLAREEAEDKVKEHGGKVTSAVSGKTSYLVVGKLLDDGRSVTEGSKYRKAVEKGTTIIPEDDFLNLFQQAQRATTTSASPAGPTTKKKRHSAAPAGGRQETARKKQQTKKAARGT